MMSKMNVVFRQCLVIKTLLISLGFAHSVYAEGITLCAGSKVKFRELDSEGRGRSTFRVLDTDDVKHLFELEYPEDSKSPFSRYIFELMSQIRKELAVEPACNGDINNKDTELSFTFVQRHFPLYGQRSPRPIYKLNIEQELANHYSCQLSSPWLEMKIQRFPTFKLDAVFNFEERQMVIDQALLAYPNMAPMFVRAPIDDKLFKQYTEQFNASYNRRRGGLKRLNPAENINMPLDIFWALNYKRFEFDFLHEALKLEYSITPAYSNLTKSLVSYCFASEQGEVQTFNKIYELESILGQQLVEDYKLKLPYKYY